MSATKDTPQYARDKQPDIDDNSLQPLTKDEGVDEDEFIEDEEYDDTYKPRPQLPQPFVFMRTLEHLMKDLDNDILDIDPEYQREVVWTADRMTGLVNSLMESFYIPPIILNKKPQETQNSCKRRHTLVCVDGKQRLSSVRAFIKGMIPCHDHRGEKWWFCNTITTQRKKVLPEETRKILLSKEFVTFEFSDLSAEQEEDLFARVQMGVQLSLAEKLRASSGPWQELAKLFVADFPTVYALMKDRARAKDFQLTLACFSQIIEVMHPTAANGIPILKTSHVSLTKLLSNKGAVDDRLKSHLASVWNTLKDLIEADPDTFTNDKKYLKGAQTFAPVEMVAVTVLISMYSNTRNNRLLHGDITALRIALREQFNDLRLNVPLWRFIWDFIEDLEAVRGTVDDTTSQKLPRQVLKPSLSTTPAPLPVRTIPSTVPPAQTAAAPPPPPPRKALSIMPRYDSVPIKEENETPDSRPRKRQRTHSNPANSPFPITASTTQHTTQSLPHQPAAAFFTTSSSAFSPQVVQNSTTIPQNNHGLGTRIFPSREPEDQRPTVVPTPSSLYAIGPSSNPSATQSRLIQVSGPQDYRAPLAAMFPPVPGEVPTQLARKSPAGVPCLSGNASSTPVRAPTIESTSANRLSLKPPLSTKTPRSTSTVRLPPRASRKTPPRPTLAQYDGAIDLTSDSDPEEQRQTLLLSFKGKALQGKQSQSLAAAPSASGGTVRTALAQRQEFSPKTQAAKLPEGFNPYAKLMNNQVPRHPTL